MVATKSRKLGLLVAAMGIFGASAESCRAGTIISAGSSGTLFYGSRTSGNAAAGHTFLVGRSIPITPTYEAPVASAPVYTAPPAQITPPLFAARSSQATTPAYVPPPAQQYTLQFSAPTSPSVTLPPVATPNPTTHYDAFINFGTAPYADQAMLTTGTAQSWTLSPALTNAYGRTPTTDELNTFSQTVLARVESTFADSGLAIRATTDPTASASHTLSVVSGLSAVTNPDAIGVARLGYNGFDFIDKLGYASSPDELQWAVARNVAHELMHTFGGSHNTTPEGNNLDASRSDWSVLVDPNTKFSAASVAEMRKNIREGGLFAKYGIMADIDHQDIHIDGQELSVQPVPEPATIALWGMAAGIALFARRKISRRAA